MMYSPRAILLRTVKDLNLVFLPFPENRRSNLKEFCAFGPTENQPTPTRAKTKT